MYCPKSSMRRLMKNYEWQARKKKIFWNLSIAEFERITSLPCVYCGERPYQVSRGYTYNGIDRKDNERGYEYSNCLPCCGLCNMTKAHRFNHGEMQLLGKTIRIIRDSR